MLSGAQTGTADNFIKAPCICIIMIKSPGARVDVNRALAFNELATTVNVVFPIDALAVSAVNSLTFVFAALIVLAPSFPF